MITKEKILEILHSHSYNVEDQVGNHLIVVDDDSWDAVATEIKNCFIPNSTRIFKHGDKVEWRGMELIVVEVGIGEIMIATSEYVDDVGYKDWWVSNEYVR